MYLPRVLPIIFVHPGFPLMKVKLNPYCLESKPLEELINVRNRSNLITYTFFGDLRIINVINSIAGV